MIQQFDTALDRFLRVICLGLLCLISSAAMVGCSENYGRLQRSREVDQIFKSYQVLPNHQYYYTGPKGRPDAIMGIHNEYSLETAHWTPFNASGDILKQWVDTINFHHNTSARYYPYGFFILNPEGSRLGIWYSIWDWTTVVMKTENRIQVFPPAKKDFFDNGDDQDKTEDD